MKHITIYTDGACSGNPGPGGWGAILEWNGTEKELSGGEAQTTNNRMELTAVISALRALKEPCEVSLYTDSKYVCDAVQKRWVYGWRARGWVKADKKPALNVDLWQELLPLLETHRVSWNWVKGHADNAKNNRCDEPAFAAVIVGLDQWTKWLTVTHIPSTNGSAVVRAIPGFFHITHIKNTGAAWSMLEGQTWLFVLVTAVFFVIVGVLIWKKVLQKKFELVCLAMIAGGALGNLIDRVVSGAVTDMIRLEFVNFPVFNVADCFVTTGCALLIVYVLFFDRPKKSPPEQDGKAE